MPYKNPDDFREWRRRRRLADGMKPRRTFESEEERQEARREYMREYMQRKRASDPDYVQRGREQSRKRMKSYREQTLYGLEPGEYEQMLEEQDHRCAICDVISDVLCVDHDHNTDEVRGLLCKPCNLLLGQAGDNVERLMRAADYLGRYRAEEE